MRDERIGLFVAGVQKAGTTTLHSLLSEHPQMDAAPRKELHAFDNEKADWTDPSTEWVHAGFPPLTDGHIRFEATPIYSFWPNAMERLHAYNPFARIILTFRDPIERAWSHWRMETARQAETLPFGEAIRTGRDRLDPADPSAPVWRMASYVERGFYCRQLERVLGLFPANQVMLCTTGELACDQAALLSRLAAFAGIAPFPATRHTLAHKGDDSFGDLPPEDEACLRDIYREDVIAFGALSGLDVSGWRTLAPQGNAPR
ncbi:MAG: sulfotransferase domain-containing protein [Hyphomonas sp.]|nr:sulfotransferase domain-containing protein [Hyphomonas sp.]